ncbi:MAG: DNA replication/repair protein RecF [Magnetococcales bacterium]|nr:DNA replication/repair protein RecF [Magnetococcales bacterium]
MLLRQLRVRHFRNIDSATLAFAEGLNLLVGDNGQGKSNLLEAVGLLATGRSFRGASPQVMRQEGAPWFALRAETSSRDVTHRLEFQGREGRLSARLDGKAMLSTSGLGRALAAVVLTPDSMGLVKGGPSARRAFLDWVIFSGERGYATLVRDYQLALRSRNRLLKSGGRDLVELEAWEERLAVLGARVLDSRRRTLDSLRLHWHPCLEAMGLSAARFSMTLGSQLDRGQPSADPSPEALTTLFRERLLRSRGTDLRLGFTSVGPHRDDVLLRMDGRELAGFASQGQRKRFILSLKLAEAALLGETLGEPPLFLLDDPGAELDRSGVGLLMRLLAGRGHQLFLTTCDSGSIPWSGGQVRIFSVNAGRFLPVGEERVD